MPSFSPTSNKAYVEFRVGIKRHACFSYVAKSKAESKKKQVMQSDQEVQVCGNFWWMEDKLLCMNQLSYFFPLSLGTRAIFLFSLSLSLFSSFLLFLTCLVSMWHTFFGYASFLSYFVIPMSISQLNFWREWPWAKWSSLFLWNAWMACFCTTPSVEVGLYISGVYMILIMKA